MQRIYMDNAATTLMYKEVADKMYEIERTIYGNPSSLHSEGVQSEGLLTEARSKIAGLLNCEPKEIYFTSGGSENCNWAIKGALALGAKKNKNHVVTTNIEHHAVLHSLKNCEVTQVKVNPDGYVSPKDIEDAIRSDTALVAVMYANNEIGTIQPIAEIAGICRNKGVYFFTDAVQAAGHTEVDIKAIKPDFLGLSAHKFHGPKGIGALYIRKGISLPNLIDGGAQERGKRSGTENAAAAMGMAIALEISLNNLEAKNRQITAVRDKLMEGLLKIKRSRVNGGMANRLPGNLNMCFEGIEGEALLLLLDMHGIAASSGSACTSGSLDPSHVLLALGLPHEIAHGSLRLSLSHWNTMDEADRVLEVMPQITDKLRDMSPVWEKILKGEKNGIQ